MAFYPKEIGVPHLPDMTPNIKVKGTHPMGGALSLLWHAQAGPIFAATMNRYKID